jgi:hypothetical protein
MKSPQFTHKMHIVRATRMSFFRLSIKGALSSSEVSWSAAIRTHLIVAPTSRDGSKVAQVRLDVCR